MRSLIILFIFLFSLPVYSQVTVISGSEIKPEAGSKPVSNTNNKRNVKKTRRVYRVQADKSFTVRSLQNVNSKLTPVGSSVYFESVENVPGIRKGTLIRGVLQSSSINKKSALVIELKEAIIGNRKISVGGTIQALPANRGKYSNILVGENFTAKTANNTLKGKEAVHQNRHYRGKTVTDTAFTEMQGGHVQVDFAKGKVKGMVYVLLEASKGKELKIFNDNLPLMLTHLGKEELPEPVSSTGIVKIGDRNKNGVMDYRYSFDKYQFVKYLPIGTSQATLQGKLKDGKVFSSQIKIQVKK